MAADSGSRHVPKRSGPIVNSLSLRNIDSEFVIVQSGRDIGMRSRIHIRTDTHTEIDGNSQPPRQRINQSELRLRLTVKAVDPLAQRAFHLASRFPDSGQYT